MASPSDPCVQELYAPDNACFGCGPANPQGLRIRSFLEGDRLVAEWKAGPHHEAVPGIVSGGIIGTLLDCHGTWAAALHLMQKRGDPVPPHTVTAEYAVKLLWPTPASEPIHLEARVVESSENSATVVATLTAGGKVCASCRGVYVTVKPGHPAYRRR